MQIETFDPLAFLYQVSHDSFPGYQPEGQFRHGEPTVVARIPAAAPEGYAAIISETRMPAQFFNAVISDDKGARLRFSTGSGPELAELLHKLCVAFSEDRVRMTPSQRLPHTMGIGVGHECVTLCFEDPVLAALIGGQLKRKMLDVVKVA